jgi:hypothetical protein
MIEIEREREVTIRLDKKKIMNAKPPQGGNLFLK